MSKYREQLRKDLGYDTESSQTNSHTVQKSNIIPGRYYAYTSIVIFFGGVIGMISEFDNENISNILLYFSVSFFLHLRY